MNITLESTVREVFTDEYLPSNLRITSPSTIRHYTITIRQFGEYLGHDATLADLTDYHGVRFCRWLKEHAEISDQTISQRMNYLRALWRWLAKQNFVEKWPTFREPTADQPLPRAWTIDQIRKLLDACRNTKKPCGVIPGGIWWYNLHRFGWETGERLGAVMAARWEDTDPGRCLVEIPGKYRKGRQKGMLYQISKELMTDLVAMRPEDEPLLFPFPHHIATFYNRYNRILEKAGLPNDRRSKFHRMRRSFASHLEASGGNATDALRHTSRRVTSDSYLDESIVKRTPSYQILPSLDGGSEVPQ